MRRTLLVIAGVVLLALFVWLLVTLLLRQSALGRLRAAGEPTTLADLTPEPIPDEQNAAAAIRDAAELVSAWSSDYGSFANTPAGIAFEAQPGRPIGPKVRELLARHTELAVAVDEAARRSDYVSVTDPAPLATFDFGTTAKAMRSIIRFNRLRWEVISGNGQRSEAARIVANTLRLAKRYEGEPMIVHRLCAIACQSIAMDMLHRHVHAETPPPDQIAEFDRLLAAIEDRSSLRRTLATERVVSLAMMRHYFPIWFRMTQVPPLLNFYEQATDLADRPLHEGIRGVHSVRLSPRWLAVSTLAPAIESQWDAEARVQAQARCARIALAIASQGLDADASPSPESLGLPAATFVDPFTGQRLVIEHREPTKLVGPGDDSNPPETYDYAAGWWVYSVGENDADDGGLVERLEDTGWAPPRLDERGVSSSDSTTRE